MNNPLWTLNTRKNRLKDLLHGLDDKIRNHQETILDFFDSRSGDASLLSRDSRAPGIRGLLIDRRTLRAISLKLKMLMTLLSKSFELWQSYDEIKDMLLLPPEQVELVEENPWVNNDALMLRATVAPFVHNDYIQPSVKFTDIHSDGIDSAFIYNSTTPERDLVVWKSLDFDTAPFSHLDSVSFFKENIAGALYARGVETPCALCLLVDRDAGASPEVDYCAASLMKEGFRCEIMDPRELTGKERFELLLSTVTLKWLTEQSEKQPLDGFRAFWRAHRIINPGAQPVFGRGIYELLTDPRYSDALGAPPLDTVLRMIPWTRIIRDEVTYSPDWQEISIIDYALRERESLVIKPTWKNGESLAWGGKMSEEEWDAMLSKALKSPGSYVIQEYVKPPQTMLPIKNGRTLSFEPVTFSLKLDFNERGDIGGAGAALCFQNTAPASDPSLTSVIIADLE